MNPTCQYSIACGLLALSLQAAVADSHGRETPMTVATQVITPAHTPLSGTRLDRRRQLIVFAVPNCSHCGRRSGPPPTFKRYCMNGLVLKFVPDE